MLNRKMLQYYTLAFLSFINGWFVSSFGPLIPHFSAVTELDETHYAYLFFIRSAGNIVGGFLIKYLLKKFSAQSLLIFFLLIGAFNLFLSTFSLSTINLSITLLFVCAVVVCGTVVIYDVTFSLFLNEEPDYWIQLVGFTFGVGAMFGPFFVSIFKL